MPPCVGQSGKRRAHAILLWPSACLQWRPLVRECNGIVRDGNVHGKVAALGSDAMTRSTRLAILGGTLLLLVAGTALATQSSHPQQSGPAAASHEPEAPPSADDLANAVDRLKASGIDASSDQLSKLAADYGLGGAVRLLAWADAKGMSVADLKAMRDDGQGWGQIAKQLGLNPGIGSIMGQGGEHGRSSAPGQEKPKPADGNDEESGSAEPEESPGS